MKTEQIIILIVAFFLGMLLLNTINNIFGCKVVEGQDTGCTDIDYIKCQFNMCDPEWLTGRPGHESIDPDRTETQNIDLGTIFDSNYASLNGRIPGLADLISGRDNFKTWGVQTNEISDNPCDSDLQKDFFKPIIDELFREGTTISSFCPSASVCNPKSGDKSGETNNSSPAPPPTPPSPPSTPQLCANSEFSTNEGCARGLDDTLIVTKPGGICAGLTCTQEECCAPTCSTGGYAADISEAVSSNCPTGAHYANEADIPCTDGICTPDICCRDTVLDCTDNIDTPYRGCNIATCTNIDQPYEGCIPAPCTTDVNTPYTGCTPAPCPEERTGDSCQWDISGRAMEWFNRDYQTASQFLASGINPANAANQDLYYFYNNGCDVTGFVESRSDRAAQLQSSHVETSATNNQAVLALKKIVPGCGYPMLIHNNTNPESGCAVVSVGDIGGLNDGLPIIKDDSNERMYIASNYSWCLPVNEPLPDNPYSCPSR